MIIILNCSLFYDSINSNNYRNRSRKVRVLNFYYKFFNDFNVRFRLISR